MSVLGDFSRKVKNYLVRRKYGDEYIGLHHNIELARRMGVKVGNDCRFFSTNFATEPYLITIGDHVTITFGVQFITHDGGVWVFREKYPEIELFGRISIGNNVFIGLNSIILPNTEVGDNSIIAAGAVVKGKYPPGSIIGGVPAKVISTTDAYLEKNAHSFTHIKNLPAHEKAEKVKALFQNAQ